MTHRVGVIGLGGIGRTMVSHMTAHPRYTVVTAWDPGAAARTAVRDQHPEVEIADGAETVVGDPRTSVIYIASPPKTHGGYIRAVADAGKAVYCEKPLGVDIAESRDLVERVARAGVPSVINFNHGNASASRLVEQRLAEGTIGKVVQVEVRVHLSTWPRAFQTQATWLLGRDQGGFTREMLSHWLYLSRRLFGDGRLIRADVRYPPDRDLAESRVVAELDYGGIPLYIQAAVGGVGPVGTEYTIWGTKLSHRLHSGGRLSSSDGGDWADELGHIPDIGTADHMRNLDAAALRFDGGTVAMPDVADGFAVQQMIETILATGPA